MSHARYDYLLLEPMRCNIAKELYWGRGRRVTRSEAFALELFCAMAAESDVVLDIGSNTGLFSIAAAKTNPKAMVHAYEIVPEVYELMARNVVANHVLSQVHCHGYGIGIDHQTMNVPPSAGGSSLPIGLSSKDHFDHGTVALFRSLDSQIPLIERARRIIMKIDVEGTEIDVFRGGDDFFRLFSPDIVCEILAASRSHEVQQFLEAHGYTFYKICDATLGPCQNIVFDATYHDWFFTKRSADDLRRFATVSRTPTTVNRAR